MCMYDVCEQRASKQQATALQQKKRDFSADLNVRPFTALDKSSVLSNDFCSVLVDP